MALVPKDARKMVEDGHRYGQRSLEDLKGRKQFHDSEAADLAKQIEDLTKRLDETADWLRNNPAMS